MRRLLVLLIAMLACGSHVTLASRSTTSEPVSSTYGDVDTWSLTEGVAVALTMTPSDAHVTFVADDNTVVRVQETSARGTFIVMPLSAGSTKLHARGDFTRNFSVTVLAQP